MSEPGLELPFPDKPCARCGKPWMDHFVRVLDPRIKYCYSESQSEEDFLEKPLVPSEQTPIQVPLQEKSKEELVHIVEMLTVEMQWYVSERNRLLELDNKNLVKSWNKYKNEPAAWEDLAHWMIKNSFATGHGDSFADLLKELTWQVAELRKGQTDKPKLQQALEVLADKMGERCGDHCPNNCTMCTARNDLRLILHRAARTEYYNLEKKEELRYCGKCNQRRYFTDGKCEMCAAEQ
jgi:hypothetical protein